jgi:PIN domain nuclease of toxin-antitoxin system
VALTVLDASVLVGFLDARDPHHRAAIDALGARRTESLVLPASGYAEVLVGPARRGAAPMAAVDETITELGIRIEPLTRDIASHAARLRATHRSLSLPDAFVLATGDVLDAAAVLTADRAWPRLSRRARVI